MVRHDYCTCMLLILVVALHLPTGSVLAVSLDDFLQSPQAPLPTSLQLYVDLTVAKFYVEEVVAAHLAGDATLSAVVLPVTKEGRVSYHVSIAPDVRAHLLEMATGLDRRLANIGIVRTREEWGAGAPRYHLGAWFSSLANHKADLWAKIAVRHRTTMVIEDTADLVGRLGGALKDIRTLYASFCTLDWEAIDAHARQEAEKQFGDLVPQEAKEGEATIQGFHKASTNI